MTVQELIDELNKIEDKTQRVVIECIGNHKVFDTEDELREYISNRPSYLFIPKAVYRLDNTILELE